MGTIKSKPGLPKPGISKPSSPKPRPITNSATKGGTKTSIKKG